MKMQMRGIFLSACAIALASLVTTHSAHADEVTDFYFQQVIERYFSTPENARTFSMGGSTIMTSINSSAVYGNPAGLGFMPHGELSGGYGYQWISGDEFPTGRDIEQRGELGMAAIAVPLQPRDRALSALGNFGVAWDHYDSNWHDDSYDSGTKRQQVIGSYGLSLSPQFSVGYSLAWTRDKLQARDVFNYPMADGFKHTVGVMGTMGEQLTVGSTVFVGHGTHHALYGPGIESDSDSLEVGWAGGTQFALDKMTLMAIGLDYRHLDTNGEVVRSIPENIVGGDENGNIFNIRAGLERAFLDWLVVRGGYRYAGLASYKYNRVELNDLNGSAYYNAFSLGAGARIPVTSEYIHTVTVDYGVEYRHIGDGDWSHLVTLTIPFELCAPA